MIFILIMIFIGIIIIKMIYILSIYLSKKTGITPEIYLYSIYGFVSIALYTFGILHSKYQSNLQKIGKAEEERELSELKTENNETL